MPDDMLKYLATMGVGGLLAGFIFMFYRKDVQGYTELWKNTAEQLIVVVKDNTASNMKLVTLLEAQERSMLRIADVQALLDRNLGGGRTMPFDRVGKVIEKG